MYHQRLQYPQCVFSIQFVNEGDVTKMFEDHRKEQIDEYETDFDEEESDFEEHSELSNRAWVTRSSRTVRAFHGGWLLGLFPPLSPKLRVVGHRQK